MSEPQVKKDNYFRQVAAAAPVFAIKSILGDFPRKALHGAVESSIDSKMMGTPRKPFLQSLKASVTGRAGESALKGGVMGVLTAPLFLSGIRGAASEDKSERTKGYGKILASGSIYQGAKGYGEGSGKAKELGLSAAKRRGMGLSFGASRSIMKAPGAIALGMAAAQGSKKGDKDNSRYLIPAAIGAIGGGSQAVADVAAHNLSVSPNKGAYLKSLLTRKGGRAMLGPAAGGVAAGLAGGLITSEATRYALKKMKERSATKTAAESERKSVDEDAVPKSMYEWFKPFPHQAAAARKILNNDGKAILAHDTGTGKTATSIYATELMKERGLAGKTLVIVPTGLRANFAEDGLAKFLKSPSVQVVSSSSEKKRKGYATVDSLDPNAEYTVIGYEMFQRYGKDVIARMGVDTIIADEVHKARNEGTGVFKALAESRGSVRNFLGLTASMVNNDPKEVASLISIAEGRRVMTPSQFSSRYTKVIGTDKSSGKPIRGMRNEEGMLRTVDPTVSYAPTSALPGESMPRKNVSFVDVPMSDDQYTLYQLALDKLGPLKKYITTRDPGVTAEVDNKTLFSMISKARQVSNSVHMGREMDLDQSASETPKVRKMLDDAFDHLQTTPDGKIVLYSNLVRGGVDVISAGLKARGVNHGIFIGKGADLDGERVTSQSRDKGVSDYKAGNVRAVILSGAGAEGLNLPDSTAFYSLDGHFNPERINQAEARARRLGGQSARLPENRVVDVRRYRSVIPTSKRPGLFSRAIGIKPEQTTDEWMYSVAKRKHLQNKSFYGTLENKTKYIRKYRDKNGKVQYEYPRREKSTFGFFNKKKDYIDD